MEIYPKKIARRQHMFKKSTCFVLMPFHDQFDEIYSEIKAALKHKIAFDVKRADDIYSGSSIIDIVVSEILASHFVIADLTGKNPNVFYEVGIAHSFKDAPNIILITQSMDDVPADLRHLTVIVYDSDNLKRLTSQIVKRIDSTKNYFEAYALLRNRYYYKINNEHDFEEIISFISTLDIHYLNFIVASYEIKQNITDASKTLKELIEKVNLYIKQGRFNSLNYLPKIIVDLLAINIYNEDVRELVSSYLESNRIKELDIDDTSMQSLIIDLCLESYKNIAFRHEAIEWLISYLKKSKVAGIDLHRAKIESFILLNNDLEIEEAILSFINTKHEHLREVIADICGEKRLLNAQENLLAVLSNEENPYIARSIITALGKLKSESSVNVTLAWLKKHSDKVQNDWGFVLDHAIHSFKEIDAAHSSTHSNKLTNIIN